MTRLPAVLALSFVLLGVPRAHAVYECGGQYDTCQCGRNNPYPCCDNGGNCTWWAWHAACCNWGIGLPGWGNANQWYGNAQANGNYAVLGYAVGGAVACRTLGTYGHVAWAEWVSGGTLHVTEQNCWGNWGMRGWNYNPGYFQGYILPSSHLHECNAGDVQVQGCGLCGTQSRGCGGDGRWGGWGACGGQGVCAPGQVQAEHCGECGTRQQACTGSCQWSGSWSGCAGADPPGPPPCETSLHGACREGRVRCVEGYFGCTPLVQPRPEVCDGQDEDCDGVADNGAPLSATVAPPPLAAEWVDGAWPRTLAAGLSGAAWLSFRNVGLQPWKAGELFLRPAALDSGGVSRLAPASGWPNVDAAAVLDRDVAPGEVALFRFPVAMAAGGGDVRERFTLAGPSGAPLSCPSPSADLVVASAGGEPGAGPGYKSVRARGCSTAPLTPLGWLVLAWPAARRRTRPGD